MASNPVSTNLSVNPAAASSLTAGTASQIVGTVTAVATEIERLIGASGAAGSLDIATIEQLTVLFGNLAGVAIQAAHDVVGKPVTPESVLALMPGATPLTNPAGASPQ